MKKIEKLDWITEHVTEMQPKGIYYDINGLPSEQKEDIEVTTSYDRLPNNEEIIDKINEIIDYINGDSIEHD
jgi:hypothetical protein